MSTVYDVILTTPHGDYSSDKRVEAGLHDLGFVKPDPAGEVWLRLDLKMPVAWSGMDELRAAVLALPWKDWGVPTLLQVLWTDEHATEDDSFTGRVGPYGWHHETWTLHDRPTPDHLADMVAEAVLRFAAEDDCTPEQWRDRAVREVATRRLTGEAALDGEDTLSARRRPKP